jgi:hypothetical protein
MAIVVTHTWSLKTPADIDTDTRDLPDAQEFLAVNDAAAREWGVSYASYDASVLPWRLLRWYNAETGEAGPLPT